MIAFDNTYLSLPDTFFEQREAQPVRAPGLVVLNQPLAMALGLDVDELQSAEGIAMLAGHAFPDGAARIAQVYAGHQFGQFSPRLGDGRALLLGEIVAPDGRRHDLHLKGSGPTLYSRGGDGRAALAPMLREYLISEAMAALDVPTTRSLAVVTTGERVLRERIEIGAVLTRVAASHLRVGTFQYFAARGDRDSLERLVHYAVARHCPATTDDDRPALALLRHVMERQAALIARWLSVGFIHGVMNTDNMTISGETIDYGPCAFLDAYDPGAVFSAIDRQGRYAFANQAPIAQWNIARFAEALLPLIDPDLDKAVQTANEVIVSFAESHEAARLSLFRQKLGLARVFPEDEVLIDDFLSLMAANNADFTLAFRRLARVESSGADEASYAALFATEGAVRGWLVRWRERLARETTTPATRRAAMDAVNPAVIPRNHLVDAALRSAADAGDLAPFEALLEAVTSPFDPRWEDTAHAHPPAVPDPTFRTFCGT